MLEKKRRNNIYEYYQAKVVKDYCFQLYKGQTEFQAYPEVNSKFFRYQLDDPNLGGKI